MSLRLFAIACWSLAAAPVLASEPFCASREQILDTLRDRHGEIRIGAGLLDMHTMIEMFASAETGTWTLVVTKADGLTCAVAAGEAWLDDTNSHLSGEPI